VTVLGPDAARSTPRRRAAHEVELGKGLRARLDDVFGHALGLALHAALLTAEARALARITRRILLAGLPTPQRSKHLRNLASSERLALVHTGIALQTQLGWPRGWTQGALRKQLVRAGVQKAPLKVLLAATETGPVLVEERGYFLALGVLQVTLGGLAEQRVEAGRLDELGALGRATGLPPRRLHRLRRRADSVATRAAERGVLPAEGARAEERAGQLAQWTQRTVMNNLDAVVNEIRETGELAALLARAGAGQQLTPEDWQKVREQLLDVVKAVPSLAVIALPGGAFLLPLLLKVLPFDIRPSSFRPKNLTPAAGMPAVKVPTTNVPPEHP